MSPPGKKSGLTTKESVEKASRPPFTSRMAPSCSTSTAGLAKADANMRSVSIWLSRPPPPWAMSTCG